jgi:hypothetical protein
VRRERRFGPVRVEFKRVVAFGNPASGALIAALL